ncbi:MAG: F0F1 ATP synthase subunit delta [Patescibacteria group bacterium]|nr:F0F1 ATP synthase subunit delta [Patescibacteria group bacterium]
MNLVTAYAALITETESEGKNSAFAEKLIAYMKNRGHLSLIPQIVKLLSRREVRTDAPVVTVAKESDLEKYQTKIRAALAQLGMPDATPVHAVDARAVGGYAVRAQAKLIDKTYRSALISLYRNVTK